MKRRESRLGQIITVAVVRPILAAVTKRVWRGQEHVPRSGGVIIAPNHLSLSDPLTVSHYLVIGCGRWPTFLAKASVFRIPLLGRFIAALGQIPVYRDRSDAGLALREAEKALTEHGSSVVIYPEGTCTRDPNLWPMVAKTGAARLALTTKAPVIPVAHWGEQHILPYRSKRPRLLPRRTVQILAGPPVDLSAYEGEPLNATTLRNATADIMRAITELQAEIRQERPPEVPYDPARERRSRLTDGEGES